MEIENCVLNDIESYFNKVKNGEATWTFFTQIMKSMVEDDLTKSKQLNSILIEEMKTFKNSEVELIEKLKHSNDILRKENASLKEECCELKTKINSMRFSVPVDERRNSKNTNIDIENEAEVSSNNTGPTILEEMKV